MAWNKATSNPLADSTPGVLNQLKLLQYLGIVANKCLQKLHCEEKIEKSYNESKRK